MNIYYNQKVKIFNIFIFFLLPISITYILPVNNSQLQLILLIIIFIELIKNFFLENYYLKNFIKPILTKIDYDDLIIVITNIFISFSIILSLSLSIMFFLFSSADHTILILTPFLMVNSILLFFLENCNKKYYFIIRSLTTFIIIFSLNFFYTQSHASEAFLNIYLINFLEILILLIFFLKKKKLKLQFQIYKDFRFLYFTKQFIKINLINEKYKLISLLILFFLIFFKIYENKMLLF